MVERLGDPGAVLMVDETGFLKKGAKSAGVQRQYSGTAGRIENCQVGVFLTYTSLRGSGAGGPGAAPAQGVGRRRRSPRRGARLRQGRLQTKPQLAQAMLERAVEAGVPAGWVTADEVYGGDARLRTCLEDHDLAYVLAVKATQPLWAAGEHGPAEVAARQLAAAVQAQVDGADGSAAGPGRVATATSGGRGGAAGGRGQAGTRMGAR